MSFYLYAHIYYSNSLKHLLIVYFRGFLLKLDELGYKITHYLTILINNRQHY